MILDLIWAGGEVLSIVALPSGAYVALVESEPFLSCSAGNLLLPRCYQEMYG